MDVRVEQLETAAECEIFARNAADRERPDLASEARRKAASLRAATHETASPVEAESFAAVYAYESLLPQKKGRKTRATGTWRDVRHYGIIEAIQRAVARPQEAVNYAAMRELGLEDLSFEALVLRHEDAFSAAAVETSKARLAKSAPV
jgi:hypothetical protein